jgi:acyl dehydratase
LALGLAGLILVFRCAFSKIPAGLGVLVASGWHTGAMLMRMVCESAIPGHATNGAIGFDNLKWLLPVRPGDVLSVENVVVEKVESRSRRDIGVVKIAGRVLNRTGEAVMSLTSLVLYRRRPGA